MTDTIYMKQSWRQTYQVVGWCALLGGVAMLLLGSSASIGVLGVLAAGVGSLIVASWAAKNPIVRLQDEFVEVQLAPLGTRRMVRYHSITEVDDSDPSELVLCGAVDLVIPTAAMDSEALERLVRTLEKKIG